ncbi:MAG: PAS domain-containing sensor histidine kinase [Anaerolineae bacterium]|nr:PAS domain-containing sensor histidine kinase [Anaerolineae bacterium]
MNAAKDLYQALFEADVDPIAVLDSEGRLLIANPAASALMDLDATTPAGVTLERLGFLTEPFSSVIERIAAGGSATWEVETAAVGTSSPEAVRGAEAAVGSAGRVLEVRLSRLSNAASGVPTDLGPWIYLWTAHDVTDRVKLERARQDLVHMVVHDLRVPLGNILNSLDLVLSAWREQDVTIPVAQILAIGLRSARRMEQLVNDILDSARLQAKRRPLAVVEISVPQMVSEAVEAVSTAATRHNQTLKVSIQPDLPLMLGDPDLLGRVLVNLLSNAVKFVQDGGSIALGAEVDADAFRFTVSDNGPGIAWEYQAAIFDLYSRGDVQRIKGAGIGLAFCKLAITAHGGRIWLDSTLGEGASFSFTIPRVLPQSAAYYQEGEG